MSKPADEVLNTQREDEYVKGEFVFDHFLERKSRQKSFVSDPVMVEGVCYRLQFYPSGVDAGKEIYISVGIGRVRLSCL